MKLKTLHSESAGTTLTVYHVTETDNIPAIKRNGLRISQATKYDHVGQGIYVFFDKKMADNIAEYIGLEDPALITIQVSEDDLLMDEDSLMAGDLDIIQQAMPPAAFEKYQQFLKAYGGDTQAINDKRVAVLKTDLINAYQIRPNKLLTTMWGHYSVMTARLTTNNPRIFSIESLDWYG